MKLILSYAILSLLLFTGCKKDQVDSVVQKERTKRTVLTYLFQDTNLYDALTQNINDMEQSWDPTIDGTLLVYVDASTRMTQFDGKPVLLEIQHDNSRLIASRIVKVYPDANAATPEVFKQVQDDVIAMYPADSYGMIMSGHGNGFFINRPNTKLISGSDRWSKRGLEIDLIANNLATHYDFIIFDACLMGETSTLYQLRKSVDFVLASVELSPDSGFAYRSELKALFTQPKADLYSFAVATSKFFAENPGTQEDIDTIGGQTIGVYRMSEMENLARVTSKAVDKINLRYSDLRDAFREINADPTMQISSSMFYPRYRPDAFQYYDMGMLVLKLKRMGDKSLETELNDAINRVVLQKLYVFSKEFELHNKDYKKYAANLSFYLPSVNANSNYQDDAFYNRFEWSAASGFTKSRE